jgi:hypothetical protein
VMRCRAENATLRLYAELIDAVVPAGDKIR